MKKHNHPKEKSDSVPDPKCSSNGFKFNFDVSERQKSADEVLETQEDLVEVEKFKFTKSDNSFRFNFSNNWVHFLTIKKSTFDSCVSRIIYVRLLSHSMLRTKMNLFSLPRPKSSKIDQKCSNKQENDVRKISSRRPPLHKIFKNCQIYPFFNFLAKYVKIRAINVSHCEENWKISGIKKKIFKIGWGVPILDIYASCARARARRYSLCLHIEKTVFGNSASSRPICKIFFLIPLIFQFSTQWDTLIARILTYLVKKSKNG